MHIVVIIIMQGIKYLSNFKIMTIAVMFTFRNYKNWAVHALNTHFFGACETILLAHIFLHCIDLDPPATTAQPTCLIMIMSISFHRFVQRKY